MKYTRFDKDIEDLYNKSHSLADFLVEFGYKLLANPKGFVDPIELAAVVEKCNQLASTAAVVFGVQETVKSYEGSVESATIFPKASA